MAACGCTALTKARPAGLASHSVAGAMAQATETMRRRSRFKIQQVMAIKITEECINCGACEPECPNNAIYEGGVEWRIADGTTVKGSFVLLDGTVIDADTPNAPVSVDTYYIVPNKCTECQGFHEEPQCAAVCPVDCCVPDDMYKETVEELMAKKEKLHI
jgi:ferredoxin